jgi:hypothetical protein
LPNADCQLPIFQGGGSDEVKAESEPPMDTDGHKWGTEKNGKMGGMEFHLVPLCFQITIPRFSFWAFCAFFRPKHFRFIECGSRRLGGYRFIIFTFKSAMGHWW